MPIEIRELIIKTTVNNNRNDSSGSGSIGGNSKEANIDEIVEKVFEIIKEKTER